MSKLVLKICCGEWKNASRDKRELSACRELGLRTMVMAKGNPEDKGRNDIVDGYDVKRYSTRPLGAKVPNPVNRFVSLFIWAKYAKKLQADILTCHDIGALFIGWLSTLLVKNKPTLIYDSHEFEIGRNAKRNRFQKWFILHLERFLINKCAFSIMVNDAIADEVQRIHNLKERPIVVRSTPNLWTVDPAVCQETRNELLQAMQSPQDTILMYHGGVMNDRGIEMLIEVVAKMPNVCAVILGNGADSYLNSLKRLTVSNNVYDRVLFHNAVPIVELWKYVGAVDMGMILAAAIVPNHLYSLPNKFFENIQSETPVVCPAYPAMQPIVDLYKFGLTCDPVNIDQIISCVERMMSDKQFYAECKQNIKIAKQDLCWEKEKKVIKQAYSQII